MLIQLPECPCCSGKTLIGLTIEPPVKSPGHDEFKLPELAKWNLCSGCCFLFQNPRPSKETLEKYYESSGYRKGGETLITQGYVDFAPHQLARFHHWLLINEFDLGAIRNSACLDFGCGIGGALGFLANQGNECWGVEIDRNLAEFGNKTFPIKIVHQTEQLPKDMKFNLIFANHAIEHIFSPEDFFSFARNSLHEKGIMILAVPAWRYANRISVFEAFGSEDTSVWDHVAMANWLNKHGFYMTSYMYQNYGSREGDWELVVTAEHSPCKNHLSFSVEEALKELYANIKDRCSIERSHIVRERVAARIGHPA